MFFIELKIDLKFLIINSLVSGNTIFKPDYQVCQYNCEVAGEYQAVKLPYQGVKNNSMIIILPDDGEFKAFENSIDLNKLIEIKENMTYHQVHLTLPKFILN